MLWSTFLQDPLSSIQIYGKAKAAFDQLKARNETCLREITHLLISEGSNCVAKLAVASAGYIIENV
jgi:hypothetical protein